MERDDLGALFARITQRLMVAERPLLAAHDLSMWAYAVLSQLSQQPAGSQLALARAIGYDKTRLIGLLDDLERDGLVTREPDPNDRRGRIVDLTPRGRARHADARADVRAMEADLLARLTDQEQQVLIGALTRLVATDDSAASRPTGTASPT